MNIMETLNKYKTDLEKEGYTVLYIALFGSQNYDVADEKSDIDAKAIVLPKLNDIIFRRVISRIKEFPEGACDIKDLVTYYDIIKKGNYSFVEPFFTEWYIGDEYLRQLFAQVPVNGMSIIGGMLQKRKEITHPYPSKAKEFELFGFDPKQYHHIIRLYDMIMLKKDGLSSQIPAFIKYTGDKAEEMKKIKRGTNGKTLDFILNDADKKIAEAQEYIKPFEKYQVVNFDKEVGAYLEEKMKEELLNGAK